MTFQSASLAAFRQLALASIIFLSISACSHKVSNNSGNLSKSKQGVSKEFPASITELTITSNGKRLPGLIYRSAGVGPHPTAIMLHGYPGNEKNLDVAQSLRSAGWNTVYFNYRGAWGAEGEFSFLNSEQDVQAVITYLQDDAISKNLAINPNKISLVGHSMGGHMAIAGILDNQTVQCAVAHDGANMGAGGKGIFSDSASVKLWSDYSDTLFMLNGWSGDKALAEIEEFGAQIDLLNRAEKLNGRAVHLIAADTEVIPLDVHITPLHKGLSAHSPKVSYQLIDDDHSFSNSRSELISSTLSFLDKHCR